MIMRKSMQKVLLITWVLIQKPFIDNLETEPQNLELKKSGKLKIKILEIGLIWLIDKFWNTKNRSKCFKNKMSSSINKLQKYTLKPKVKFPKFRTYKLSKKKCSKYESLSKTNFSTNRTKTRILAALLWNNLSLQVLK